MIATRLQRVYILHVALETPARYAFLGGFDNSTANTDQMDENRKKPEHHLSRKKIIQQMIIMSGNE